MQMLKVHASCSESCVTVCGQVGMPVCLAVQASDSLMLSLLAVTRRQNLIPPLRPTCVSGFSNCPDLLVDRFSWMVLCFRAFMCSGSFLLLLLVEAHHIYQER